MLGLGLGLGGGMADLCAHKTTFLHSIQCLRDEEKGKRRGGEGLLSLGERWIGEGGERPSYQNSLTPFLCAACLP